MFGLLRQSSLCVEMKYESVINASHSFETHLNLPKDFTGSLKRMLMIRSVGSEEAITASITTSSRCDAEGADDDGGEDGIRMGGFFFIFSGS